MGSGASLHCGGAYEIGCPQQSAMQQAGNQSSSPYTPQGQIRGAKESNVFDTSMNERYVSPLHY